MDIPTPATDKLIKEMHDWPDKAKITYLTALLQTKEKQLFWVRERLNNIKMFVEKT